MSYQSASRSALWAVLLGGLTTLVAGPITFHLVGPLVLLVVHHPTGSTWDPIIGGTSLTLAGALVVLVLGRVVQLPPKLAAAGVGGMGTFWMALIAAMSGGLGYLWSLGLVFRVVFAGVAALVAGRVARFGYKRPSATATATETATPADTSTPTATPTPAETEAETPVATNTSVAKKPESS